MNFAPGDLVRFHGLLSERSILELLNDDNRIVSSFLTSADVSLVVDTTRDEVGNDWVKIIVSRDIVVAWAPANLLKRV